MNLEFINLIFISDYSLVGINIKANANEYMSSVINKYITISGNNNPNIYIFNGQSLDESSTVGQSGLILIIFLSNLEKYLIFYI